PFISWRLFVSEQRLAKAKERCSEVDQQASVMANRITQVEIENEEQQGKLDVSLQASSSLREKCAKEQTEHAQLQKLWKETQPELLLSVLSECLEFFFTLIIRQARLSSLSMRQRMAKLDIRPYCGDTWTPDSLSVLVDWVAVTAVARSALVFRVGNLSRLSSGPAAVLAPRAPRSALPVMATGGLPSREEVPEIEGVDRRRCRRLNDVELPETTVSSNKMSLFDRCR
ncbi:unnamed protein product, partial [Polarella glacialis]